MIVPGLPDGYSARPLVHSDLDAISLIHRRACLIAYAFFGWNYSFEEVRDWYAGKFADFDWSAMVHRGEEPAGYLAAIGSHLDQIFIDPDHQRRGLGEAMIHAMIARGRPVTLHYFAENLPARALYERLGFVVESWFVDADSGHAEFVYRLD